MIHVTIEKHVRFLHICSSCVSGCCYNIISDPSFWTLHFCTLPNKMQGNFVFKIFHLRLIYLSKIWQFKTYYTIQSLKIVMVVIRVWPTKLPVMRIKFLLNLTTKNVTLLNTPW